MRTLLCPIGSRGFVYPMLGLASELRRRGHQCAFATSLEFAAEIESSGFERIPRGATDGSSFQVATWGHPLNIAIQVRHLQHAIGRFGPDVVVADPLAIGGLIAGEIAGLPVAVLGLATYLWPVALPGGGSFSGDRDARWRQRQMQATHEEARVLLGLHPSRGVDPESLLLGSAHLLRSIPELQRMAACLPARVKLVGACLHEPHPPDAELMDWLASPREEPLVYVQHGSVFAGQCDYWPGLVAAADVAGVRLAASLERRRRQWPEPPSDRFLARGFMLQQPVLQRARGVVASGNTTAVLGALTHGLPMLLLPSGGEQPSLTAHCVEAGAAIALDPDASAAELTRALRRLLDDHSLRESALRLQAAFARYDGPRLAADAVSELARLPAGLGAA